MTERTEKGTGTIHRAKDAPPLGGKRQYELRFVPTYVWAGDVKVEGIPDLKGFIELLDPLNERLGSFGESEQLLFLRLEDGRWLPFFYTRFSGNRGYIAPRGSLE
jgi:hypothetical protein